MNLDWQLKEIDLDLAFDWSISREVSKFKKNFFICINEQPFGEIALNKRFDNGEEEIRRTFVDLKDFLPKTFSLQHTKVLRPKIFVQKSPRVKRMFCKKSVPAKYKGVATKLFCATKMFSRKTI